MTEKDLVEKYICPYNSQTELVLLRTEFGTPNLAVQHFSWLLHSEYTDNIPDGRKLWLVLK
jgi:hypothetical protein